MDSLVLPFVNAETMSMLLALVASRHADEFVLMVMDQAGWHIAGSLEVPSNMRIVFLPPCSPELNPVIRRVLLGYFYSFECNLVSTRSAAWIRAVSRRGGPLS